LLIKVGRYTLRFEQKLISLAAMKPSARSPAHDKLRSSTHHLHQLVDNRFDLASISSAAAYSTFLLANWPLATVEVALEGAGIHHVLPDWDKRRRREALAKDLGQLGISPPGIDRLEIDSDQGTLLGWSYVLEGSRLGAGMILQAIGRPGEQVAQGTQFLRHGHGEHFWQSFKATLSEIDADPSAILKACEGAKLAFECFLATRTL
jgi:heme oxygenase